MERSIVLPTEMLMIRIWNLRVDITDPLNSIYDIFDRSVSILIQYFPNNKIAEGSDSGISSEERSPLPPKFRLHGFRVHYCRWEEKWEKEKNFSEETVVLEKSRKERIRPLKSGWGRNSGIRIATVTFCPKICVTCPDTSSEWIVYPFHEGKAFVFSLLYAWY